MNQRSKKVICELTAGIKDVLAKALAQTLTDVLHKNQHAVKKYRTRRHKRRFVKTTKLIQLQ